MEICDCKESGFRTEQTLPYLHHIENCRKYKIEASVEHILARFRNQNAQTPKDDKIQWYHCEKCSYKAKYKFSLKRHISYVHEDDYSAHWHKCELCLYKGIKKEYLERHINRHHLDEKGAKKVVLPSYKCDQCVKEFKYKEYLDLHQKATHYNVDDIKWYNCTECSFKSNLDVAVESHMQVEHSKPVIKMFKCKKCSFKSDDVMYYYYHITREHLKYLNEG